MEDYINTQEIRQVQTTLEHSVKNWRITLTQKRQDIDKRETYIETHEIKGHMCEGF